MTTLDWILSDVRESARRLTRRPRFTALAAGTLALGLATSTAVFSYVNAYQRAFPGVPEAGLYQVWASEENDPWTPISYPDVQDLAAFTGASFQVTGFGAGSFAATVRRSQATEVAFGQAVLGGFFTTLGIEMSAGRGFSEEDDRAGAVPTTVLAFEYWTTRYGADPSVIGEPILLNNEPYLIVGVAGPEFLGTDASYRPQFWLPFEQYLRVYRPGPGTRENREAGSVRPILRLADGTSTASTRNALAGFAQNLDRAAPLADRTRRFVLEEATWISPGTRDSEASTTRMLIGAAGFLLLLACANVANLVLSAGARREAELAIRRAIGASRIRLVWQLLTESLLLSALGGAAAFALAGPAGMRLSSYFARPSVWGSDVSREILVSPRVMLFAFGVAVGTGLLTGLVPAVRGAGRHPAQALGAAGTRSTTRGRGPLRLPGVRDVLVSSQVAICVVLLFVAGLVLRTMDTTRRIDPGFDVQQTIASYVSTSSMGIPIPERHAFYDQLRLRLASLSWVEAATVAENAPLSGHPVAQLLPPDRSDPIRATVARVWPGYFEMLSMDMARGRAFLGTDSVASAGVVIVNESLAERLVGNGDPVGQTVWLPGQDGEDDQGFSIVGVARDARQVALLEEPGPVAYFSLPQVYSRPGNALVLKVRGDPAAAVELLEQELHEVDTRLAIVNILPYRDVVRGSLYAQRMNAELFTVIAVLGLLLAASGIFAVVSLAVTARRREIGIRIAVGADWAAVTRSVAGPLGVAVLAGLVLGGLGALGATRWVESLLWGVAPNDPLALSLGVGSLVAAVVVAAAMPLTAAIRIDPAVTLRAE